MKPSWGPGWIGFGHSYAGDGEYDQAILAYSTAANTMKGSHIPLMCIAGQYLKMNHFQLCDQYLCNASKLCSWDPQLNHEIAVVDFKRGKYEQAIQRFEHILSGDVDSRLQSTVWCNLGQCYLRIKSVFSFTGSQTHS